LLICHCDAALPAEPALKPRIERRIGVAQYAQHGGRAE
jgi:hypothetical protein